MKMKVERLIQLPVLLIDLSYLFIRACESLTIMFHLFGPDAASKGMIYRKDRDE